MNRFCLFSNNTFQADRDIKLNAEKSEHLWDSPNNEHIHLHTQSRPYAGPTS